MYIEDLSALDKCITSRRHFPGMQPDVKMFSDSSMIAARYESSWNPLNRCQLIKMSICSNYKQRIMPFMKRYSKPYMLQAYYYYM